MIRKLTKGRTLKGEPFPVRILLTQISDASSAFGMRMMCAAERCERIPRRGLTLERYVVKHPAYPDLVTGWGV
jgi:hypothetical protein